jgi:hypothetical protein
MRDARHSQRRESCNHMQRGCSYDTWVGTYESRVSVLLWRKDVGNVGHPNSGPSGLGNAGIHMGFGRSKKQS